MNISGFDPMNIYKVFVTFLSRGAETLKKRWRYGGGLNVINYIFARAIRLGYRFFEFLGPKNKYCPCCGWHGSFFTPYIDLGYVSFNCECPECHSHPRHRGQIMFYRKYYSSISGQLLYIAPEKNVAYFTSVPQVTVSTSSYPEKADCDFCFDLCDIAVGDEMFDYIICNHVLEHVTDDKKALLELHRILKPGGALIFSVPIDFGLDETRKYGMPDPSHSYHYYTYGKDFVSRIPGIFKVEEYDFKTMFTQHEFQSMNLLDDKIFVCKKSLD